MSDLRRVVLAYSGGLDTSVILRWLIDTYGCEVVCYIGDVGQDEDVEGAVEKALNTGAKECVVRDLRE
jgi:argininosuccinate synthase